MRKPRVLVDQCSTGAIRVDGGQAIHVLRVLRLSAGDEVTLFDRQGGEVPAALSAIGADWFEATATAPVVHRSKGPHRLILAVAPPKGERADWLVEKCAELGADRLVFIQTARGVVQPGAGKLERWRRKAVEAARQAATAAVMTVDAAVALADLPASLPADTAIFFGDPRGDAMTLGGALRSRLDANAVCIAVGPEGGFTADECSQLQAAGGTPVALARSILRVETAAVAAAAIYADWCAAHDAANGS